MEKFIADLESEYLSYLAKLKQIYDESLRNYREFLRRPIASSISFNFPQCNLNCDYCYAKDIHNFKTLDIEEYKKKLLLISKNFEFTDTITVFPTHLGESLFNQAELLELFKYLESVFKKHKLKYYFLTNGTIPLSKDFTNFLLKRDVYMQVSFDFFPALNDRHRKFPNGSPSSYKIISFIKRLRDLKIPFQIRMTLSEYSLQVLFKAFDFLSHFFSERCDINLMFPENSLKKIVSIDLNERRKAIGYYILFYVLNRLLFRLNNLNFVLLKPSNSFCYYKHNIVFVPGTNYISGCLSSFDQRTMYAEFEGSSLKFLNKDFLDYSLNDLPKICLECPFVDFCGTKGCIKVKEQNQCPIRFSLRKAIFSRIEEKYQTYPIFQRSSSEVRLIHLFKTLHFHHLSAPKSEFLFTENIDELIPFVEAYKGEDFKVILFLNKEDIPFSYIKRLSTLLNSRHLFVFFARTLHSKTINAHKLSHRLIIPKEEKYNLDFIKYSSSQHRIFVRNHSFPFSLKANLFDRVNFN